MLITNVVSNYQKPFRLIFKGVSKIMRSTKNLKLILLLIILFSLSFAINADKVYEETLSNGLNVIAYEMKTSPMIYSRLTYDVGAKHEVHGQTGISHIVEHMMFKGTGRFSKGKISKLISENGGVFNAFTSSDITVYYELMPKNKIDLAFDIESERMYKCKFDEEEFKSEINVIKEERKMRTENNYKGQKREEVNTIIYKSHPYRNPVIGWMHDINEITRAQAYAYYKKYYTPNNATLVLVGDFEIQEILKKVKKYFGKIPKGPKLEKKQFVREKSFAKKTIEYKHSDIVSKSVNYYFHTPARGHEDGAALYVASRILGGRSATTRMYKRLVRKEELCKSAGGGYGMSKDSRTFNLAANLRPEADIEEVEKAIWEEIDSLKNYPVENYDFNKIKNVIEFKELTGDQYISKVGDKLGMYENYYSWQFINEWTNRISKVTKQDVMDVMKRYLNAKNMVVCYSLPDTTAKNDIELAKGQKETAKLNKSDENNAKEIITKKSLLTKIASIFKKDIPVEELYKIDLADASEPASIAPLVKSFKLDNGTPVYYIINHDFPAIYMLGAIKTGRIQEDMDNPGFSKFVQGMLNRGTAERTYDEMLEERSFTPYQANAGQSWNTISFSGYALKRDADKMFDMVHNFLVKPVFPEEQMDKIRPKLINVAKEYNQKKDMQAFYKMFRGIFKEHHYALPHGGDPETYKNVTRDQIVEFYNKYYSPKNMKIVVVGDFEANWLKEKLNKNLGQWKKESHDAGLEFSEIDPVTKREIHVTTIPEGKQCRVDIGFNPVKGGIKIGNPDIPALKILERVLCGSTLTSRMGVELRDNRGLCYGIRSNMWIRQHGGYWNIRTNTDADNVKEMVNGMMEQIEMIQKDGITQDELDKAKYRTISLLSLKVRTADDIGALVYNMLKNNQPLDYFDNSKNRIMAVTLEDVKRVANKYLDTKKYIMSVSGNIDEDFFKDF